MLRWTDGAGTARACSDEFVFAPKLRGAERRAVHTLPVLTLFTSRPTHHTRDYEYGQCGWLVNRLTSRRNRRRKGTIDSKN